MPLEYSNNIDLSEQLNISLLGLEKVISILNKYDIASTIYCTSIFAKNNQDLIKKLSETHEIASHTYKHSKYDKGDAEKSKIIIENIIKKYLVYATKDAKCEYQ